MVKNYRLCLDLKEQKFVSSDKNIIAERLSEKAVLIKTKKSINYILEKHIDDINKASMCFQCEGKKFCLTARLDRIKKEINLTYWEPAW